MIRTEEEHLAHYGILRRSGRYPWGSGGTQSKRNKDFLDTIEEQKKAGMTETEIARGHGITTTELRAAKSQARAQQRQDKILTAQRLKDKGWSNTAIGERMGLNESSVRALLAPGAKDKADALQTTANMLKDQVNEKTYVDIGGSVHLGVGVTRTHLDTAVAVLREQGYEVHNIYVQQIGTGKYTTVRVLAKPGTTLAEVNKNRAQIKQITEHSDDHGRTFDGGIQTPLSVSSRRVKIVYGPEGAKADGVIYVRPGVEDIRMGSKRYAQVRIAVDGTHYLKGMAVYKDDLPAGTDLVFHTSVKDTGRKKDAMKPLSDDPDFPFGSVVRQIHGKDGKVNSAMNLVNEEGQWDKWSRTLSSQMLSKQNPKLAQQQLDITYDRRKREFDEINSLTNPTVRKELLNKFADSTDSAAVHLKAASLPRQSTKVLLPVNSVKPGEIYAPTFRDGERVALVRYPHGGTFEIPQLTVNNRNREARKILGTGSGDARHDAVGIHHSVAKRLSGADFDGDTVLVIPNNNKKVESTPALEGLKDFDPMVYKVPKGSPIPRMTDSRKQQEMGNVSNLITDMTIHGASAEEKARAIRHSMVVIDAEKHHLDWRQSEKDNGILTLKEKYQGRHASGQLKGASTLISRAGAETFVRQRRPRPMSKGGPVDPVTGKKVYVETGRQYINKQGKPQYKLQRSKRLAETDDAHTLSSGTRMEEIYANHSNKLKALANSARKTALPLKGRPMSESAKKTYAKEVASLNSKLAIAESNAPRERQAQVLARSHVALKRQANPGMDKATLKKVEQQALTEYRIRTGAKKDKIKITQAEWDAIQAGAISTHKLEKILNNSDADTVKALALPKHAPKLTSAKLARAQRMLADGYTQAEVADHLGIGLTTLKVGLQ